MEHLTEISRWRAPTTPALRSPSALSCYHRTRVRQWPSELNDAEEQADRFNARWPKDSGATTKPCFMTTTSSAFGTACPHRRCGVGIDRLMMLLTDSPSIRDVICFRTALEI
jgi:hypothetical protein